LIVWKDGLLIKLKRLGITGNMYEWIRDFLTNRTIQVRLGNKLSEKLPLENGTPQGSAISPLLFLLMINDFPDPQKGAKTSIFADDSAVWKSGVNLKHILGDIQENFADIQIWCNNWGFKISESKTIGVLFTKKNIQIKDIPPIITMNGIPIKFEKEVKFLGLIFDHKLTWDAHINYIVTKCKTRLNLLRSLSGTHWGASKQTQLTIYRTLIRSVIDYACAAYDTASVTAKAKLEVIQSTALRICCGAMKGTPNSAVQVEMGEKPVFLRRKQIQAEYAIKITIDKDHPTRNILEDCWQNHYGRYPEDQQPFSAKVENLTENLAEITIGPVISPHPPWKWGPSPVDLSLTATISKKQHSPEILKTLALSLIESYRDKTEIYTDGSKSDDGKVGSAYYVPSINLKANLRITDNTSVYASELKAILMALSWTRETNTKDIVIFSDSLSALQSLKYGKSKTRPNLLQDIINILLEINQAMGSVTFAWIPSHVGVRGNETVDMEAKMALTKPAVESDIKLELQETKNIINNRVNNQWQEYWNNSATGQHYKQIQPHVDNTIKFTNKSRRKETTITRLRLGKCFLNKYMHRIKLHPDGLCATCGIQESIEHFLLKCQGTKELTDTLKDICKTKNIELNIKEILTNKSCTDAIYAYIRKIDRRI